jgi:S-adenosylmethionine-diacylglycerol 3-amino-3-carboxypropyl transferase
MAASGDHALAPLLDEPHSLIAVDRSLSQCCLMELKLAALERLSYGELLEFVGFRATDRRAAVYRRIRHALSPHARVFWNERKGLVERGILHVGRLERYFALFRRFVLPCIHSRRTCEELFACRTLAEQRDFYRDRWDRARWRWWIRVFFNRAVMGRLGREVRTFRYVERDVAATLRERARHALTEMPVAGNWFLSSILCGSYEPSAELPPYLREENHAKLRGLLPRVTIVHDDVERLLGETRDGTFHKFCLSDVFEYLSEEATDAVFAEVWRTGAAGATISYRELMVPRAPGASLAARLVEDEDLGAVCHRRDRSFVYGAHHVLTVRGKPGTTAESQARTTVQS